MAEGPRSARKSPAFEVQTRFANEPFRCENYGDGRPIELTSLWEHVQRVGRLPLALDRNALFRELSSRMGYPEWEVRQHALRVLADLAPALPRNDLAAALDSPMLLPATVTCLGHPSAAVRRAALDALRALLVASEDPDLVVDALVIHGLDGADPEVAMGVILGVPALLSPRLPHHGLVRLVSALARKVIHSAFHEEALETLSKIRSLVGEGQFDRFLSGFPPKYKRDFRALFRAHDVRSDNEDSSAETRARVREMLASGILNEVENQEVKKVKTETAEAAAPAVAKVTEKKEPPAANQVKSNKQKAANLKEVAEEEEIDSANGSRPASAETKTEEKKKTLQVPTADKDEEDEATLSDNDRTSVDTRGKGSEGGGGTEEEGGELEEDEDSGVEGSGGRGEETTGAPSPPPTSSGRVLLETEIQFSEATAITMTILEEADVASNEGDPIRRVPEEYNRDFAIRVLETSEEDESAREDGRGVSGRRVRFGGETLLQTPDSAAETLEVPKRKEEAPSLENSSEDPEAKEEVQQEKANGAPFVSHIPVRIDGSKKKGSDGEKNGEEVVEVKTEATENTKVKLEAEGKELELLVQEVSGESQDCEGPVEIRVEPHPTNRIHGWEDLGIVDKSVLMDIKNKEDWQARGRGMQILKTALRDPMVASMLYSHLPEFLLFLEPLLEDRSIPVVTAALGIVRNLASTAALRPRLSSPAILRRLTSSLTRRAAHSHIAVRAASAAAAKALMRATGPRTLLPPLLTLASAPRAPGHRVRESALILALHALLAFPSAEFDAAEVARRAVPALADPKRRVRQAALECMAVLAQFVPPESLPLDLAAEKLRSRKARKAMEAAVAARLSRRRLPVLTTDGLILYALQIPPTASRGMPGTPTGADVDWILAGTGSISAGSALSRGNFVLNRNDSPLLPTTVAQVPVYCSAPSGPLRNRPDSPVAWAANSQWGESRRNLPAMAPLDQRSQSAGTLAPLHAVPQESEKPASSPSVGTSTLSPWSAAAGRRKAPTLQVASLSSSFSSSTSSTSSASSASTSSTNHQPTIGYFRPVYNGPRQLGIIEDVVSERGFSILPNDISTANAVIISPANEVQGSRRLRSPSPPASRRRRHLTPFSRQSSTDSRPSTPTSNDSSIPPHSSAPLPVVSQTTIVSSGRRSVGGHRIAAPLPEDITDCANAKFQERLVTSDDSSTPSKSDSTVRGKAVTRPLSVREEPPMEKETLIEEPKKEEGTEPGTAEKAAEIEGAAAEAVAAGGVVAMAVAEVAEAGKEAIQSTHPCVPEGSADAEEGKGAEGEVEGEVVGEKGEVVGEAAVEVGEAVVEVVGGEGGAVEEVKEVEGSGEVIGGSEEGVKGDVVEEEVVSAGEGGGGEDVGAIVEEGERVVEEGSGNETEKKEGDEEASTVIEDEPDGSQPKSNCGGVAVPIDLSAGLLTVEIDDPNTSAAPFSPPPRPNQLNCTPAEEFPMSASFTIPNMHGKGTESSTISTSSVPPGVYSTKNHAKHQRLSLQHRENRRSMPPRNGFHKHSMPSLSSAPNVHPARSSTMSTALFPETLPPLKNPKESMKQAFQSMDDPDWEVAMKGLEILVRLIRHHPSYVHAELTRVIATLGRQIRNLRSQVARAACQASGELALPRVSPSSPSSITSDGSTCASSLLKRALEADLEEVAAPLLHRSADTNRFLRDDCVAALDRFVAGVGPSRVVGPILSKGVTHQNALVRTVTARLLATIVAKLGADRVMTQLNKDVRAKVLRAGANLLMEGSLQTRTFAKQVFRCLASHENFDRALTQAVPSQVLRNIHKTLLAIKKESIASNGVDPAWNG